MNNAQMVDYRRKNKVTPSTMAQWLFRLPQTFFAIKSPEQHFNFHVWFNWKKKKNKTTKKNLKGRKSSGTEYVAVVVIFVTGQSPLAQSSLTLNHHRQTEKQKNNLSSNLILEADLNLIAVFVRAATAAFIFSGFDAELLHLVVIPIPYTP